MSPYHKAMPLDPIDHHNRFQLWISVLVALMSGAALFLRFNAMGWDEFKSRFAKHMAISVALGLGLAFLLGLWIELPSWQFIVLLVAASIGIVANVDYMINFAKGKLTSMAAALAHGGFALMLVGIMASGLNKRTISENRFAQEGLAEGLDAGQNAFLIKDMPMFMNGYWVTYRSDTLEGLTRKYALDFIKVNEAGDTVERFTTYPNILYNREMTKVATANPNTKRYIDRDVFTFISGLPPEQQDRANLQRIDSMLTYTSHPLAVGDTLHLQSYTIRLDSILLGSLHREYDAHENDLVLSGIVNITDSTGMQSHTIHPTLIVRNGLLYTLNDQVNNFNLRARIKAHALDSLLPLDEKLSYESLVIKSGETKSWKDLTLTLQGIDKNIDHPGYKSEPDDIAIQAMIQVKDAKGKMHMARPLFFIRNASPLNLKAYLPDMGLHIKLEKIDPEKEEFYLSVARLSAQPRLALEFAPDAPRNDYIVLEAILFPGINLFWAGSLIMLFGLFLGMYKRLVKK